MLVTHDPKQTSQLRATDWAVAKPCTYPLTACLSEEGPNARPTPLGLGRCEQFYTDADARSAHGSGVRMWWTEQSRKETSCHFELRFPLL
jgi:hypothetical protein